AADDAPYVTSLTVDGSPVSDPWLQLSDITGGPTVAFGLSTSPDTRWGTGGTPPSFLTGEAPGISFTRPSGAVTVPRGGSKPATVGMQNVVESDLSASWSVSILSGSGLSVTPASGTFSVDAGVQQKASVQVKALASARSGTIVLRVWATAPGGTPVRLASVIMRVVIA